MTLLTTRRSFAALAAIAALIAFYFTYTGSQNTQISLSAMYALLGIVFAVMAFEERLKSKQAIPVAFPLLSVANFALAVWSARIGFLLHS
jgi:drug/metabolite transporter (DMT)-like permease